MHRLNQTGGRLARLAALGSQLLNVVLFDGSPDETVSGRAHREGLIQNVDVWERRRRFINRLFFWSDDHCQASHMQDVRMARALLTLYGDEL